MRTWSRYPISVRVHAWICVASLFFAVCEIVICDAPLGFGWIEISPHEVITSGLNTTHWHLFYLYILFVPEKGSHCQRRTIKWKSMTGYNLQPEEKRSYWINPLCCCQDKEKPWPLIRLYFISIFLVFNINVTTADYLTHFLTCVTVNIHS